MTAQLPQNLLALFAPRPALRWMLPNDHAPEDRKTAHIDGVAQYLPQLKEEFGDYTPTESWLEKKDRTALEKEAHQKWYMEEGFTETFNPKEDKNIRGDPYKTLFVSRLSYDTETKDIEREFGRFGPIERVRIVVGSGENDEKHKNKPRGYAFVVFERERDMKGNAIPTLLTTPQHMW
jgi:U1 small nuclear ribonucleoprotein